LIIRIRNTGKRDYKWDSADNVSLLEWFVMLCIRIDFNANTNPAFFLNVDPDPAFYLSADPDPESQTNADPSGSGSWSEFAVTKNSARLTPLGRPFD
jgi:hypothetical protein